MMEAATSEMASFVRALGYTSIQVSALIGLILLVRLLFGRYLSARWRYALWFLICIRILIPWGPDSPLSLEHWGSAVVSKTGFLTTRPSSGAVSKKTSFSKVPPSSPMTAPISVESALPPSVSEHTTVIVESGHNDVHAPNVRRSILYSDLFIWGIGLIWLMGMGALAGRILYHRGSLLSGIRDARPLRAQVITDLLNDCRMRLGVRTPVHCIATDAVAGPALLGWIHPRLLLPRHLLRSISRRQLRHIFLHELTHLRRQDIFVGWIVAICQTIHWFNPLVWVAFYLMRADREIACDHEALSILAPSQIRHYGLTLLRLLERCDAEQSFVLACIFPERLQVKQRVRSIVRFEPGPSLEWVSALIFALLAIVGLTRAQPVGQRPSRSQVVPISAAIVAPIQKTPVVTSPAVVDEPDVSLAVTKPVIVPSPETDPADRISLQLEDRKPSHDAPGLSLENSLKAQERAVLRLANTAKQAILNGLTMPPDIGRTNLSPNNHKAVEANKPVEARETFQTESFDHGKEWVLHVYMSVQKNSNGKILYPKEMKLSLKGNEQSAGWFFLSCSNVSTLLPGGTLCVELISQEIRDSAIKLHLLSKKHHRQFNQIQTKPIRNIQIQPTIVREDLIRWMKPGLEDNLSRLHQLLQTFNAAILSEAHPIPTDMMCRKGGLVMRGSTEHQLIEALARLMGELWRTAVVKAQIRRMIQIDEQAYDAVKTEHWDDAHKRIKQLIEEWQRLIEQVDPN